MNLKSRTLERWDLLILFVAILFGAWVRFTPALLTDFPINDGGMFYSMIADLKANHYLLPASTSYNNLNIPYAYPPLTFYVGGFLSALLPLSEIFRWLPPLVSTGSILAFFWLASLALDSRSKASLATVAYALMPRSFSWYVMGGGLSRSFGVFFLLLTAGFAWLLFTRRRMKFMLLTMLFGTGAILSHPETGVHAAAVCALIWFFRGRTWRGFWDALFVTLGVAILSSLWWGSVLSHHGLTPFLSVFNTGGHDALFWLPWITFDFSEERFVTLLTVLGLIGFAVQAIRREWLLPIWVLLPFAVEPRSAPAIAALPLAMLAGVGLADLLLPALNSITTGSLPPKIDAPSARSGNRVTQIILGYLILSSLFGAYFYVLNLSKYTVSKDTRAAMEWVEKNTPAQSRFILLTGSANPFADPPLEWFPTLTGRTSQNTIQGKEWLLGPKFMSYRASLVVLQNCSRSGPDCVTVWADEQDLDFDYIFIQKKSLEETTPQNSSLLLYLLQQNSSYELVFENDDAAIFKR